MTTNKCYLDTASTTDVHPEVLASYVNLLKTDFYNCDALYDEASRVSSMMEKARAAIAKTFKVLPEEVIFTSGASEANTSIIKGIAFANPGKKHIITSAVEHSSVENTMRQLEEYFGYEVTRLPVDISGSISIDDLRAALRADTVLVSLMMVNNETGAINPINEAKKVVQFESDAFFHVDAVQALGKLELDLKNIDAMSLSAHKIEGLNGSGVLIKKKHVKMLPLICGGQQERGLRGGTSNALVNTMFAKTLRLSLENQKKNHQDLVNKRKYLVDELLKIEGVTINSPSNGVPSILNFSYPKIPSEVMMNALNNVGIMVSAQSTCASHAKTVSRVLKAMGLDDDVCHSCIRVSFDYHTSMNDLDYFLNKLKEIINYYG